MPASKVQTFYEYLASNYSIYLPLNFFKRQESGGKIFFNYLEGQIVELRRVLKKRPLFQPVLGVLFITNVSNYALNFWQ